MLLRERRLGRSSGGNLDIGRWERGVRVANERNDDGGVPTMGYFRPFAGSQPRG